MRPVYEPSKMTGWIAPPARGIHGLPNEFVYVRV
jgi:benzoyl-CoA 2,3-epoxidase subunit B